MTDSDNDRDPWRDRELLTCIAGTIVAGALYQPGSASSKAGAALDIAFEIVAQFDDRARAWLKRRNAT